MTMTKSMVTTDVILKVNTERFGSPKKNQAHNTVCYYGAFLLIHSKFFLHVEIRQANPFKSELTDSQSSQYLRERKY